MSQDLSNYGSEYYLRDQAMFRPNKVLRPDQLAAICYALNWPYWGKERDEPRDPGLILSIGAGRGELEAEFERLGHRVVGIDPSAGSRELYAGRERLDSWTPELVASCSTIIHCESLEHIPWPSTQALLELASPGSRLIFVNFVDFWPLEPSGDGWDHITLVDDRLYDVLSVGRQVVVRRGSHLVLDILV